MSFYPERGPEINRWTYMPQVPQAGDSLHYSLTSDPDDSRAWHVIHVSWVSEVVGDLTNWHAEIGLS